MGWCDGIHCDIGDDGVCVDCGLHWVFVDPADVPYFVRPSLNLDGPIWKRQIAAGEVYRHAGIG